MNEHEDPPNRQQHEQENVTMIQQTRRPAYEKLMIGPILCFSEDLLGGHYLEILKLSKQMSVGHFRAPTYAQLHASMVAESGMTGAFYKGFYPWGLMQCAKGVPVLFVEHEVRHWLLGCQEQQQQRRWMLPVDAEKISGFVGGASQALLVCPLQKIKLTVVVSSGDGNLARRAPTEACLAVIRDQGILSLWDGLAPTMLRRSLDWGIRFGACSEIKKYMLFRKEWKQQQQTTTTHVGSLVSTSLLYVGTRNGQHQLTPIELLSCGFLGGACSALTHPIDNIVTSCQKPLPQGVPRDVWTVVQRMYIESGWTAFSRGWVAKVIDNSYHMLWMYGVGSIVYEFLQEGLHVQPARATSKNYP